MNTFDYHDFIEYLQHVLEKKQKKNSQFSLRAFARLLEIAPSTLSEILSRNKKLSKKNALKILKSLTLSKEELRYLLTLIEKGNISPHLESDLQRRAYLIKANTLKKQIDLNINKFKVSWVHFFLITASYFIDKPDKLINYSINALDMDKDTITVFYNELLEFEFIVEKNDKCYQSQQKLVLSSENDNQDLKKIHHEFLDESKKRLEKVNSNHRYSVTELVTIPTDQFSKVKLMANEFLDYLSGIDETHNPKKDTTVIGISLHINDLNPQNKI